MQHEQQREPQRSIRAGDRYGNGELRMTPISLVFAFVAGIWPRTEDWWTASVPSLLTVSSTKPRFRAGPGSVELWLASHCRQQVVRLGQGSVSSPPVIESPQRIVSPSPGVRGHRVYLREKLRMAQSPQDQSDADRRFRLMFGRERLGVLAHEVNPEAWIRQHAAVGVRNVYRQAEESVGRNESLALLGTHGLDLGKGERDSASTGWVQ